MKILIAIVAGNFNATPDSAPIKMMREALIDTDPKSRNTWSNYPEGCPKCIFNGLDTRLDYIFVSKNIKYDSFKVHDSKASDHLPISINIKS